MKKPRKFLWKEFGSDLRTNRVAFKWGLREAARQVKMHHATYCRAEHGRPIEVPDFVYLCWWIGVRPEDYLPR